MKDLDRDNNGVAPSVHEMRSTPRWSSKWPRIVGGVAILGLALCIGCCTVTFGSSTLTVITQKDDIMAVLDEYMLAMTNGNAEHAHSLFTDRVKRQMPLSKIEGMLDGANYMLFDGYLSLRAQTLRIGRMYDTDPNRPQGTVAHVDGTVSYADGYVGNFQAILEKEGTVWKLYYIRVNAPAEKFNGYPEDEQQLAG
jgi:hypothetical protein